jgi:hypothetical protein
MLRTMQHHYNIVSCNKSTNTETCKGGARTGTNDACHSACCNATCLAEQPGLHHPGTAAAVGAIKYQTLLEVHGLGNERRLMLLLRHLLQHSCVWVVIVFVTHLKQG